LKVYKEIPEKLIDTEPQDLRIAAEVLFLKEEISANFSM